MYALVNPYWRMTKINQYHKAIISQLKINLKNIYETGFKTDTKIKRTESPQITPHTYSQLVYNKEGKNIEWRNDTLQ